MTSQQLFSPPAQIILAANQVEAQPECSYWRPYILLPAIFSGVSLVFLAAQCLRRHFAKRNSPRDAANLSRLNFDGGPEIKVHISGWNDDPQITAWKLARFLAILALLSLSIKIVLTANAEPINAVNIAVYAYALALAACALASNAKQIQIIHRHLGLVLASVWVTVIYRNIWPLATFTSHPIDIPTDALFWPKFTVLTFTAIFIPLFIPNYYIPLDQANPAEKPAPEQTASRLSRLVFSFLNPMIWAGYRTNHLSFDGLAPLADYDYAVHLRERGFKHLDPVLVGRPRHAAWGLLRIFTREYGVLSVTMALRAFLSFLVPIGVERLLAYVESGGEGATIRPWVWILVMAGGPVGASLSFQWYLFVATHVRVQVESLVTQLVLETALCIRVPHNVDERAGNRTALGHSMPDLVGMINNLVTSDLFNIVEARDFLFFFVYCPIKMVLCMFFLYRLLGWSALVGLATILLTFPIPLWIGRKVNVFTNERMKKTDARVQFVAELMNVLRMIKLLGWERNMGQDLREKRDRELFLLKKGRLFGLLNSAVAVWIPLPTICATYSIYTVVLNRPLTPSVMFSSLAVFDQLREVLEILMHMLPVVINAKVSLDRLTDFLKKSERVDERLPGQDDCTQPSAQRSAAMGFNDAAFSWASSKSTSSPSLGVEDMAAQRDFVLHIAEPLMFQQGALNLVVGPTGSGKTALLLAILGEMHTLPGHADSKYRLQRHGGVAYAAQEAWVLNQTIRDNIVFGAPFDEERYHKVLYQCALERDLSLFEAGDGTEVGEKGVTLSGGQKARISLARAIYSSANALLLDDILSALDVHTSRWIVRHALRGDLAKNRTIILVTHSLDLFRDHTGLVVSIGNDGRVCSQSGLLPLLSYSDPSTTESVHKGYVQSETEVSAPPKGNMLDPKEGKLIAPEEMEVGHVSWSALMMYLRALGGLRFWVTFLLGLATAELLVVLQTWFLGLWARNYEHVDWPGEVSVLRYLAGYVGLLALGSLVHSITQTIFVFAALRASRSLHDRLMDSVMGATFRWLDTTPVSRVIVRATNDLRSVDGPLADLLAGVLGLLASILVKFLAVVSVSPVFLLPGLAVGALAWWVSQIYMASQLSVKREMANARAPVLAHIQSTISGLASIRAYGVQQQFALESMTLIDKYTRTARSFYNLTRWVTVRVDFIGAAFSGCLATYLVYGPQSRDAALAGFSMVTTMAFTGSIHWLVFLLNAFEVEENSLERIKQYTEIEQEPKFSSEGVPPAYWPASGRLSVRELGASYSQDGPQVLHDISFDIGSGERVGIVGRTGSGKSSLTLSLLRCIFTSGRVYYDGLDTSTLNLDALRSNIAIIPQDPQLLGGSLRSNLDPFEQHEDAVLNEALHAAGLFSLQTGLEGGRINLDSVIASGGSNLSLGQRQIIALARAMVKRSRILILDEATAAIDHETDTIIQESIRNGLKDVTVITVAHRLRTVMDADKIMVLDAGRLVEFDTPKALLEMDNGLLRSLVEQSGDRDELMAIARSNS